MSLPLKHVVSIRHAMECKGIYIISAGRPVNVNMMQCQHLIGLKVTWVVPFYQVNAYEAAGAQKLRKLCAVLWETQA